MRHSKRGAKAPKKTRDIEVLKKMLGGEDFPYRYRGASVPLLNINVLPQPRKTFENIPELAEDISRKGILNPPTVARLNVEGAEKYITVVNMLWDTKFSMNDLFPTVEKRAYVYYILLAGERRYRAAKYLWEHGCESCGEENGGESRGSCFRRHFSKESIEVRLCEGIPPLPALFIQLSENTHMQVPPHEEAKAYSQLFRLIREADPKFALAVFARNVGRSAETVRHALKFCELPDSIQEAVEVGLVPYGIAIELTRLHQSGMKEEELSWWLQKAIVENKRIPEFREMVTRHFETQRSGQQSLMGLMTEEQEMANRRKHVRQTVESQSVTALWAFIGYIEKVTRMFEDGRLGQEDSPFSAGSPSRILRELLRKARNVLPHVRSFIPRTDFRRAETVVNLGERVLSRHIELVG